MPVPFFLKDDVVDASRAQTTDKTHSQVHLNAFRYATCYLRLNEVVGLCHSQLQGQGVFKLALRQQLDWNCSQSWPADHYTGLMLCPSWLLETAVSLNKPSEGNDNS